MNLSNVTGRGWKTYTDLDHDLSIWSFGTTTTKQTILFDPCPFSGGAVSPFGEDDRAWRFAGALDRRDLSGAMLGGATQHCVARELDLLEGRKVR